jgi:hypothetical protein
MRSLACTRKECAIERKDSKKRVVLDLLSLTEEAAMWQKSAFAKRAEELLQLQEDFGFSEG